MKKISVTYLENDTYFDKPVFLDEGFILLSPEIPVSSELISRLKKWNFNDILTDGSLSKAPDLGSESVKTEMASIDQHIQEKELQNEAYKTIFSLNSYTEEMFKTYFMKNQINMADVTQRVKDTIDVIKKDRDILLGNIFENQDTENYLISHTVNTVVLSVALGDFLKFPPHRLIELGLAAFLHEIGMIKLPSNLYNSERTLTQQEMKTIMAHTDLGYRILKGFSVNEKIAQVALEHHERYDGSGYPRGLKGDEISVYARVIAVACSYDSLISQRPFRDAKSSFTGLLDLLKVNRRVYDETVLKALIFILSVYPLGSAVLLSNGSKGKVYKTNPQNPKCPVVKVFIDSDGKKLNQPIILQTSIEHGITITKILDKKEIE